MAVTWNNSLKFFTDTNVFGASATQNSNFVNIANQPTLGFGTLAQQGGQENKPLQPTTAFTKYFMITFLQF